MLVIIFKFFALIFALGTVLELIYNFPLAALDILIIALAIFLYYLFRVLKLINKKGYWMTIIAGMVLSILNFLPIEVHSPKNLAKYTNQKGIVEVLLKGNIYKEIRKDFKVKNLTEFTKVAQIYLIQFFLKRFYC